MFPSVRELLTTRVKLFTKSSCLGKKMKLIKKKKNTFAGVSEGLAEFFSEEQLRGKWSKGEGGGVFGLWNKSSRCASLMLFFLVVLIK